MIHRNQEINFKVIHFFYNLLAYLLEHSLINWQSNTPALVGTLPIKTVVPRR